MKIIKYNMVNLVNVGTAEEPIIEKRKGLPVEIPCTEDILESNLAMARMEAFEEPIVEDNNVEEIYQPSDKERLEALEVALLEMMGVAL